MQDDKEKETSKLKQLKLENELLRLELKKKHGGKMPDVSNLPPELEHILLKSMFEDEEASIDTDQVTVLDYVGRPEFKKVDDLEAVQIQEELERIRKIMAEKRIIVEPSFKVSSREMYRFITEDIFNLKIPANELKSFYSHFNYDDFYPDDNEEIKAMIEEFLDRFFISELKLDDSFFTEKIECFNDRNLSKGKFMEILSSKKEGIVDFELNLFRLVSLHIVNQEAEVTYEIDYGIIWESPEAGVERSQFNGNCVFKLKKDELNYWSIYKFTIPGFDFC